MTTQAAAPDTKKKSSRSRSRAAIIEAAKAAVSSQTVAVGMPSMSSLPTATTTPSVPTTRTNKRRSVKRSVSKASKSGNKKEGGSTDTVSDITCATDGAPAPASQKRKNFSSIKSYIHKLWRQRTGGDHDKTANKGAMVVLQDATFSIVDRIAAHVQDLKQKPFRERMPSKKNNKQINARDIQSAFKFMFSRCHPQLYRQFLQRGADAVKHFKDSTAASAAASASASSSSSANAMPLPSIMPTTVQVPVDTIIAPPFMAAL